MTVYVLSEVNVSRVQLALRVARGDGFAIGAESHTLDAPLEPVKSEYLLPGRRVPYRQYTLTSNPSAPGPGPPPAGPR